MAISNIAIRHNRQQLADFHSSREEIFPQLRAAPSGSGV
jgi:hypothetical protein